MSQVCPNSAAPSAARVPGTSTAVQSSEPGGTTGVASPGPPTANTRSMKSVKPPATMSSAGSRSVASAMPRSSSNSRGL